MSACGIKQEDNTVCQYIKVSRDEDKLKWKEHINTSKNLKRGEPALKYKNFFSLMNSRCQLSAGLIANSQQMQKPVWT